MIGYAMCGSFCTHKESLTELEKIKKSVEVLPILSFNAYSTDTRFGTAIELISSLERITGNRVIHTITEAEPLGPKISLDCLLIAPCTGNTLAKIAHGITDTPVTMAAKAHLRSSRPLVIALASNDAMAANLENIALLLNRKNVFFVPLIQDDVTRKPHSLVADFSLLSETYGAAMNGMQVRPLFLEKRTERT